MYLLFIALAEPIYVGDPRPTHSQDISGVIKKPNLNIVSGLMMWKFASAQNQSSKVISIVSFPQRLNRIITKTIIDPKLFGKV